MLSRGAQSEHRTAWGGPGLSTGLKHWSARGAGRYRAGQLAHRPAAHHRGRVSADNQQAKGKRGGLRSTSWKPGCPSPNPGGRPRSSLRAAEAVRELVDPAEWVEFELALARDEKQSADRRAAAWHALIDRGFVRPPTTQDITVSAGTGPARDYSALPLEKLLELEAMHNAVPTVGEPDRRLLEPRVPEDYSHSAHRSPTDPEG